MVSGTFDCRSIIKCMGKIKKGDTHNSLICHYFDDGFTYNTDNVMASDKIETSKKSDEHLGDSGEMSCQQFIDGSIVPMNSENHTSPAEPNPGKSSD
jgi:hypothetical protein